MTTEQDVVRAVVNLVRTLRLRVPSPDYLITKFYAPQWRVLGSTYYYQLPRGGRVVAIVDRHRGVFQFSETGLSRPNGEDYGNDSRGDGCGAAKSGVDGRGPGVRRDSSGGSPEEHPD